MKKILLIFVATLISFIGYSQQLEWTLSKINPGYLSVLDIVPSPNANTLIGSSGMMRIESSAQDFQISQPAGSYPQYEIAQLPPYENKWISFEWDINNPYYYSLNRDQPYLNLVLGTGADSTGGLYVGAFNGPKKLRSLYCGVSDNYGYDNWPVANIVNEDTLFIEYLDIPRNAVLNHYGPAPLVITKQGRNWGTLNSHADNVLFPVDRELHRQSVFVNKGTVVGDIKYEIERNKHPDFVYWSGLWQWFNPINLEDSINIVLPFVNESIAANLQYLLDNELDEGTDWAAYLDSIVDTGVPYYAWQADLQNVSPLKGVRLAPAAKDRTTQAIWKSHTGIYNTRVYDRGEDFLQGIEPEDLFTTGSNLLAAQVLAIPWDGTAGPSYYNGELDTLYFVGDQVIAEWDWMTNYEDVWVNTPGVGWELSDVEPIYTSDSAAVVDISDSLLVNIDLILQGFGGTIDGFFGLAPEEGKYEWHDYGTVDTGPLLPGTIAGAYSYYPHATSSRLKWAHDINTVLNQSWEDPNHLFIADTLYSFGDTYDALGFNITVAESWQENEGFVEWATQNGYQDVLPDNYPNENWDYGPSLYRGGNISGFTPDMDTPIPFPMAQWYYTYGNQRTERIEQFRGMPWLNSPKSYEAQPLHDDFAQSTNIPNLPINNVEKPQFLPFQSPADPVVSSDEQASQLVYNLPFAENVNFVYSPSADAIFEFGTWQLCVNEQIILNPGTDSATAATACASIVPGGDPIVLSYVSNGAEATIFTEDYWSNEYGGGAWPSAFGPLKRNAWAMVTNPLTDYLDLDKVANEYFETYPEVDVLEFAWYDRQNRFVDGSSDLYTINGGNWPFTITPDDPEWGEGGLGNMLITNPTQSGGFWRRRYYRYGDGLVLSERDYWLQTLYNIYQVTGGAGWTPEAIALAEDYQDGVIDINDGPAFNYLYTGQINPNRLSKLGRYAAPHVGFWVRNYSGVSTQLIYDSDMGAQDWSLPDYLNEDFVGETGPVIPNRARSLSNNSLSPGYGDQSYILTLSYQNDTNYFPFEFAIHKFNDNEENGTHQLYDVASSTTMIPYCFTDNQHFAPSQAWDDKGPQNSKPTHIYFPPPPIDGAWKIFPAMFQEANTGSSYIDDLSKDLRIGIRLIDDDENVIQGYKYLDEFESFTVNYADHTFPLIGQLVWTTLDSDFDGDGMCTTADLVNFLPFLGQCNNNTSDWDIARIYDVDNDECVDSQDLLAVLNELGCTIGSELGEFESCQENWMTPTVQADIENAYVTASPNYKDAGYVYNATQGTITMFGQTITAYDGTLKVVAQGRNTITIPDPSSANPLLLVSDRATAHITPNSIQVTPAYDPGSYTYNTVSYTAQTGSGLIKLYDQQLSNAPASQWANMYTNFDVFTAAADPQVNASPYINQLYYGWNSNRTGGELHSPSNAKTIGFVDMFGAGPLVTDLFEFNKGVYGDAAWYGATQGYKSLKSMNANDIFEPKNISLAYITKADDASFYTSSAGREENREIHANKVGGNITTFGKYAKHSLVATPATSEWGYLDTKEALDAQIHQGVIAMVDHMTLREYFKFKLQGVSPKFGVRDALYSQANHYGASFGNPYNLSAVIGEPQQTPAKAWAPNICTTYDEWTNSIVAPFFAAHMGQPVSIDLENTPPVFLGIETNTDATHYQFITQSPLNTVLGSYGPLVYDFDWNGIWDQKDLDIWNIMTGYWSSLGDDANKADFYAPANYYRSGTDALNAIVNVLPDVDELGDRYEPSPLFEQYFDITTYPYVNNRIANWSQCLDGYDYVEGNQTIGSAVSSSKFQGSTDLPFVEPATFSIATSENAPRNGRGAVEITDYHSIPTGYQLVPSGSFFPHTLVRN